MRCGGNGLTTWSGSEAPEPCIVVCFRRCLREDWGCDGQQLLPAPSLWRYGLNWDEVAASRPVV